MTLITGRLSSKITHHFTATILVAMALLLSACNSIPTSPQLPNASSSDAPDPSDTSGNPMISGVPASGSEQTQASNASQANTASTNVQQKNDQQKKTQPKKAQQQLLNLADEHIQQGQYEQAVAIGERLLRINRSNAEVYLLLAKAHFANGVSSLANQFARQGLAYAKTATQKQALQSIISNY